MSNLSTHGPLSYILLWYSYNVVKVDWETKIKTCVNKLNLMFDYFICNNEQMEWNQQVDFLMHSFTFLLFPVS